MLDITHELYVYALYILLISAASTCVFVIFNLRSPTQKKRSIKLYQLYFILGLLGWLVLAIKDLSLVDFSLSLSATSYIITSYVLFLAIIPSARNLKIGGFVAVLHMLFLAASWLATDDINLVLTISVYILLAYSAIFLAATHSAIQTSNLGTGIIAFATLLVALAAPIQIQKIVFDSDVNLAYSIVLITSNVGFVLVGIGFLTSLLIDENKLLSLQALKDPLTGLLNRRGLDYECRAVVAASKRNQSDISVIALDIDYFKSINDRYGHDGGDKVLVELANIISSCPRDSDICCRLGGEEFVIVLPDTSAENSMMIAERIRRLIEDTEIVSGTENIKLTSSFGVASENSDIDIDRLLKAADKALYQAKSEGRNCVKQAV